MPPKGYREKPKKNLQLEQELGSIEKERPPLPTPVRPKILWTREEKQQQVDRARALWIRGYDVLRIHRALKENWPALSRQMTERRVADAKEQLKTGRGLVEVDADRAAAIERIHAMMRRAEGQIDPKDPTGRTWVVRPDPRVALHCERLLMELQGTKAPDRVDVNVVHTQAMMQVIAGLTPERGTQLLEEALREERLAELAVRELPALAEEIGKH